MIPDSLIVAARRFAETANLCNAAETHRDRKRADLDSAQRDYERAIADHLKAIQVLEEERVK